MIIILAGRKGFCKSSNCSEKLKQMKKAVAIEAGTAVKFQLEQQLLDEEAKLAYLSDELDKLESALQS